MTLLSIDPATHGCGVAFFSEGVLLAAAYTPSSIKDTNVDIVQRCVASAQAAFSWGPRVNVNHVDELAVELPQIYSRGANKTKGDPNKTALPMAMVDAALAAMLPQATVFSYQPHAWKGTTQKPKRVSDPEYVIIHRVRERLTPAEQQVINWGKSVERSWDIADAVAIGLFHLGRFGRVRTFARE